MVKSASLDETFAALADPTRRAILDRLAGGERTVGDLATPFAMSLPAVSKHLRVLERAGLVTRERRGRVRWCRLSPEPIGAAMSWLERYRRFWAGQFDALDAYLDATDPDTAQPDAVERNSTAEPHSTEPAPQSTQPTQSTHSTEPDTTEDSRR